MKNNILTKLVELRETDFYPFHMPGHKRQAMPELLVTQLDITEIDGYDNLYSANGILKDCMDRAAKLYGSKRALLGVNGSTGNLLTAITAAFRPGDTVMVARNCHKAVYNAIELRGLKPLFLYPETENEYDICVGISSKQVKEYLKNYERSEKGRSAPIAGMILTSPTYEGITSPIREIATLLHERNAVLIVDEAHGAHFGFHPAFPESAVCQGADLVIQSLHKTLPAMTQTSLLHVCTSRVSVSKVEKYFGMYQTSSPSYVLMASVGECITLLEHEAEVLFETYFRQLNTFYEEMLTLSALKVMRRPDKEIGKLVICVPKQIPANRIYNILREKYHLQPEMCGLHHVLLMTSVYDTEEGFERLKRALVEIDEDLRKDKKEKHVFHKDASFVLQADLHNDCSVSALNRMKPKQRMLPFEAVAAEQEQVPFASCAGRISAEYLYLYPPGIPYIIPGEEVDPMLPHLLEKIQEKGYCLLGRSEDAYLSVVQETSFTNENPAE